jgi:branched-chain amino acid transport system permease protein
MFGIGAYATGIMFVHVSPTLGSAVVALLVAVVVASLLSAAVGWLAFYSRTKVSDFYIAVVTLGISMLFGQVVLYGGALTGGSNGLSGFTSLSLSNRAWYFLAGAALLVATGCALKIVNSDFGLVLRAIRDNELRCRYLGIKTPRIKAAVFTISNAVIAAAGVFYALYTTVVSPSLVGLTLATNVLIWVILGGRGTIIGPAIAAILVTAVTPQLSTTFPLYWQGLLGLVFVLVVVFLPKGVLPALWQAVGSPFGVRANDRVAVEGSLYNIKESRKAAAKSDVVLAIDSVSRNFGSFVALSDVSFDVRRGELLSIVGPNGAGKTSLVRCISDGDERSSGSILVDGDSIGHSPPDAVAAQGIGRKFQAASVFETLTVGECLKIATWKGKLPSIWRRTQGMSLSPGAAEVVKALGLVSVWNVPARDISHGQRQALELAMVLALEPSAVILDEPTAGLTTQERAMVGDVLTRLVETGQLAVILIEHDFEFVKRISSRIVVLVAGKLLADGTVHEIANSEIVRDAYLGRSYKEQAE